MSTAVPEQGAPQARPGQPWQPAPDHAQPAYPQTAYPQPGYPQGGYPHVPPAAPRPRADGNVLRRWPVWAQNTALAVGAVAVLLVVFFAGFFTANAVDGTRGGVGTDQNIGPRFGNGNGFGGQSGNGFGGQTGNGSGTQSGNGS